MNNNLNRMSLLLVIFMCNSLTSCMSTTDITSDHTAQGGYGRGELYVLQKDLAIDGKWLSAREDLVQSYHMGRPRRDVIGVVKQGELLKIVRVLLRTHPDVGDTIHPIAVVETGAWKGREVDLWFVSQHVKSVEVHSVRVTVLTNDPDILQRKSKESEPR